LSFSVSFIPWPAARQVRETPLSELATSRRKRDELLAAVRAMRHITNLSGEDGESHDASTSAPLPLLSEVIATNRRVLVFFELEPLLRHDGGLVIDMLSLIEKRGRLKEDDARQIFAKLVLAVKTAHDMGVVLRNIKPEIIQVREGNVVCCANPKVCSIVRPPYVTPSAVAANEG